jgi:hypothetical protein
MPLRDIHLKWAKAQGGAQGPDPCPLNSGVTQVRVARDRSIDYPRKRKTQKLEQPIEVEGHGWLVYWRILLI